jgi:hypothetical protein
MNECFNESVRVYNINVFTGLSLPLFLTDISQVNLSVINTKTLTKTKQASRLLFDVMTSFAVLKMAADSRTIFI